MKKEAQGGDDMPLPGSQSLHKFVELVDLVRSSPSAVARDAAKRLVDLVPGARSAWADTLRQRLRNRRPTGGPVILMYHRIGEPGPDPWELSVSPAHFAEQMEVLRNCRQPMALRDFGERDGGALPADAVAVTFDDGYADNFLAAKPILQQCDIPATVFVTASAIDNTGELWWDELERILLTAEQLPAELRWVHGEREISWVADPGDRSGTPEAFGKQLGERWRAYEAIYEQLLRAPYAAKLQILRDLAIWAGVAPGGRSSRRLMTRAELIELARGGLVTIGAHTETHPVLAGLDPAEQWTEISRSKILLEEALGQPVDTFAYPYGSYDAHAVSCVRRAGFTLACHTRSGTVGRYTNRFELPRLHVRDWDGDQFARLLSEFTVGKAA